MTKEREQQLLNCIAMLTQNHARTIAELEEATRKIEIYQKNGVTCQTYGHTVGNCAECNTHDENYKKGLSEGMNEFKDLKTLKAEQIDWDLND